MCESWVNNIICVTEQDLKSNKYSKEEKIKIKNEMKKVQNALEKDDLGFIQPTFPLTHNDDGGSTPMNL